MTALVFDAESKYFSPDFLVRYEEHEDHLKGRPNHCSGAPAVGGIWYRRSDKL